jgi:hypothetical protein
LIVEEAASIPVSFGYYRSAEYADEQVHTVLTVQEAALKSEIERLDAWLLEASAYLQNHTDRFSGRSEKEPLQTGLKAQKKV